LAGWLQAKISLFCPCCKFEVNFIGELKELRKYFASNGTGHCPRCFSELMLGPEKWETNDKTI